MAIQVIKATNRHNGEVKYYSGGAGDNWLTDDIRQAFNYRSYSVPEFKAAKFNQYSVIHGYNFEVITL